MFEQNSYQAYMDSSLIGSSPVRLVTALYQGAIDATVNAQRCFETNDIMGRSRMVTKAVQILTELMLALDHEKGGEMSANLKRLYSYMQQRLLTAHTQRQMEPLREVERLLRDMIEAWYKVAESHGHACEEIAGGEPMADEKQPCPVAEGASYGSYFSEAADSLLGRTFSF